MNTRCSNRKFRKTLTTAGNSPGKGSLVPKTLCWMPPLPLSGLGATPSPGKHLVTVCARHQMSCGNTARARTLWGQSCATWHRAGVAAAPGREALELCAQNQCPGRAGEVPGLPGLVLLLLLLRGIPGSCSSSGFVQVTSDSATAPGTALGTAGPQDSGLRWPWHGHQCRGWLVRLGRSSTVPSGARQMPSDVSGAES